MAFSQAAATGGAILYECTAFAPELKTLAGCAATA
jgi:hypothetical protein